MAQRMAQRKAHLTGAVVVVIVVIGLDSRSNQETDKQPPGQNWTELVCVLFFPIIQSA
jgi:hypothetical protein